MTQFAKIERTTHAAGDNVAEMMCERGMNYALGRDCEKNLVAAHTWFNIAAVKGSARADRLRAKLTPILNKQELAVALRAAREWMTVH